MEEMDYLIGEKPRPDAQESGQPNVPRNLTFALSALLLAASGIQCATTINSGRPMPPDWVPPHIQKIEHLFKAMDGLELSEIMRNIVMPELMQDEFFMENFSEKGGSGLHTVGILITNFSELQNLLKVKNELLGKDGMLERDGKFLVMLKYRFELHWVYVFPDGRIVIVTVDNGQGGKGTPHAFDLSLETIADFLQALDATLG
ncbi:MAG: hypothetical protein WC873_01485 [Candidatus Gracilibacteria bacterium]